MVAVMSLSTTTAAKPFLYDITSQGREEAKAEDSPSWKFAQCFGDKNETAEISEGTTTARCACCIADVISAVQFDPTGDFLASGDRAGRVVMFERNQSVPLASSLTSNQLMPPLHINVEVDVRVQVLHRVSVARTRVRLPKIAGDQRADQPDCVVPTDKCSASTADGKRKDNQAVACQGAHRACRPREQQ